MKKFIARLLSVACAVAACASLAVVSACSQTEEEPKKPAQATATHDADTYKVTGTEDEYKWHNFVDGKCTMCDETTIFTATPVYKTDIVSTQSDTPGKVEKITYNTRSYVAEAIYADKLDGKQLPMEKTAYVYTPYGYDSADKDTKYNVLYLLHGNGGWEGLWFAFDQENPDDLTPQSAYSNDYGYGSLNVLNYLMDNELAEKTIVVTPTFYSNGYPDEYPVSDDEWRTTQYFGQELINDLMPYIAKNYNTYAEVTDDMTDEEVAAALKAARDYQGYAGLSMGSVTSFNSIWRYCLEYFAYIGSLSAGAGDDTEELIELKNTTYKDCDVKYWYASSGSFETPEGKFQPTYLSFVKQIEGMQHGSDIEAGDNCEFMVIRSTAHTFDTWVTDLYNFMQVFFKA